MGHSKLFMIVMRGGPDFFPEYVQQMRHARARVFGNLPVPQVPYIIPVLYGVLDRSA